MQAGETIRVVLCGSVGAYAIVWIYFHRKARRNTLLVIGTMSGSIPVIAAWAWAVPFYVILSVTLLSPWSLRWATIDIPGWVRACGTVAVMPTPFFCWWVLNSLGDNFTEAFAAVFGQRLVTRGPYRYVRHPLYAVECVFLVSIACATASWFILGYACSGVLAIRFVVIPHEEGYMLERFGRTYGRYRKRTGMFLPKLRGARKSASRRGMHYFRTTGSNDGTDKFVNAHPGF